MISGRDFGSRDLQCWRQCLDPCHETVIAQMLFFTHSIAKPPNQRSTADVIDSERQYHEQRRDNGATLHNAASLYKKL